ncbi:MAG: HAD family hydrolase [Lachnospiraceae bacterium]|nr:HAD family hydrolase [Lachnospiraceae bacterium]
MKPPYKRDEKILFTDMDGTLLREDKSVSPHTYRILQQWTAAGNLLVLCTGRAMESILATKKQLKLDFPGVYLIGCNGGEIYDCGLERMILKKGLSMDIVSAVMARSEELGLYCQTYTDTHILSPGDCPQLAYYRQYILTPVIITREYHKYLTEAPGKCLAIELEYPQKLEQLARTLKEEWGKKILTLYSNPWYLEIIPGDSGKGNALIWLCRHLGIPLSRSLAAGDEVNDISMLQAAGLGIAMANARESVKAAADMVTKKDHQNDGLAEILQSALHN